MKTNDKESILKELQIIPGVGKSIAIDLYSLGIHKVSDLKGKSPEKLYNQSCNDAGQIIDRCLLYVYRCAVYFATNTKYDEELLKWWNWTDERMHKRENKVKK